MGGYGVSSIHPVPMIETNNTLSNPEGPEWQFLVGEGKFPVLSPRLSALRPLGNYTGRWRKADADAA